MSLTKRGNGWCCELIENGIEISTYKKKYGTYYLIEEPYCKKCSYPGVSTPDCTWHWNDRMDRTYSLGVYLSVERDDGKNDLLSMHITGLKRYINYSVPLGLAMALCLENVYPELKEVDMLVPIPKHTDELKTDAQKDVRYNQALELANIIGGEIEVDTYEALLKTEPHSQRGKNWSERTSLPDGLYVHDSKIPVEGKSILLIDDVRTSGTYASACADELYAKGASKVNLFVAGRDVTREWKPPKRGQE